MTPYQFFGCRGRAEIAGKSHDIATGCGLHFADRLIDADLRAAGDNNARIFARQACGNREADTGGAPRDERALTIKVKVHGSSFRPDPAGQCQILAQRIEEHGARLDGHRAGLTIDHQIHAHELDG